MFCTDELQDARTEEGGGESNQSISPSGYPKPPRGEAERDAESILITPLHRPTQPALGDPLLTAQAGLPNKLVVWKMVHSHGTLVPGEERERRGPEARTALEMMGKEELNMISA